MQKIEVCNQFNLQRLLALHQTYVDDFNLLLKQLVNPNYIRKQFLISMLTLIAILDALSASIVVGFIIGLASPSGYTGSDENLLIIFCSILALSMLITAGIYLKYQNYKKRIID